MPARIPGFGNIASSAGAAGIGGASQLQFDLERQLAEAALRAKARMKGANLQADATRYAGQQAANATMFGAIAGAVGSVVAPIAGGLASGAFNQNKSFQQKSSDYGNKAFSGSWDPSATWKSGFGVGDW